MVISVLLIPVQPCKSEESTAGWKAGCATSKITPEEPLPMAGYASRKNRPSEGTEQDLFAKALALEDPEGKRFVFLTTDLIGITASYRTDVAKAVEEQVGLDSHSLLMNASHTHCGPAYGRDQAAAYYAELVNETVQTIAKALESLEGADLFYSTAHCGFAMNRRTPTPDGFRNHPNPNGIVDHTVPVLSVRNQEGRLKAVVFGYSCHSTTIGIMKWGGDYAGYAQEYLEADHDGLTALFLNGCSGDQNPYPRSELHYAQRHGRTLATAVESALETNQKVLHHQRPIEGPVHSVYDTVTLPYTPQSGRGSYEYPIQAVSLGDDLVLIAMGGEVTIDYSHRFKRDLQEEAGPAIWVAGYSNDYNGYVPSKRVLLEGGYEAASRPWQPVLEEKIATKVGELYRLVTQDG